MAKLEKLLERTAEHLDEDEQVLASVLGEYEAERLGTDVMRTGVFVATDRRLVFYAKKVTGYDFESFPYENISSFEQGKNMMGGTISFYASGNQAKMKWIKEGDLAKLAETVRVRMKGGTATQPAVPEGTPSAADRIRELVVLHDEGLLSDDEFEEKRKALLEDL